jgi:hypothetical protein
VSVTTAAGVHCPLSLNSAILLFGMPRSGTTWLGKIFDSHPATLYRHEPDSVLKARDVPMIAAGADDVDAAALERFLINVERQRTPKVTAKLPMFRKRYHNAVLSRLREGWVFAAIALSRVGIDMSIPDLVALRGDGTVRIVWKSIESVGRVGAMAETIPQCRIVVIVRHPCGFISSTLRGEALGKFDSDMPAAEDTGVFDALLKTELAAQRGLTREELAALSPIERLAWRWLLFNEPALALAESNPAIMPLCYETLCADPVAETRRLFEFAGLAWSDQTGNFLRYSTAQEKEAYYSIVKDPLKSANKWRESFPAEDIARVGRIIDGTRAGAMFRDAMTVA